MSIANYIESLEAELGAAAEHLPSPATAEDAQLALERAGDALRAGASLPRPLAHWNLSLEDGALSGALELGADVLHELALPSSAESELLDVAALARDRVESLLVGVRQACIASGRIAEELPQHAALVDARARVDAHLREVVSRQDVEAALGERRAHLAGASWTDTLNESEAQAVGVDQSSLPRAVSTSGAPSDAVVTSYIVYGKHAGWVEGFAARDGDFAEELDESVAMLREAGETVGLSARRWQALRSTDPSAPASDGPAPLVVLSELRPAKAAATADVPEDTLRTQLGILDPTAAEGLLEVDAVGVRLRVYAVPGHLKRVRFGVAELVVASDVEEIVLEEQLSNAPWTLEVEAVTGASFAVRLGVGGADA